MCTLIRTDSLTFSMTQMEWWSCEVVELELWLELWSCGVGVVVGV